MISHVARTDGQTDRQTLGKARGTETGEAQAEEIHPVEGDDARLLMTQPTLPGEVPLGHWPWFGLWSRVWKEDQQDQS